MIIRSNQSEPMLAGRMQGRSIHGISGWCTFTLAEELLANTIKMLDDAVSVTLAEYGIRMKEVFSGGPKDAL